MRPRPSLLVAVVLVLALVAGCGGGSDELSAKEQKFSDAFRTNLTTKDSAFGVTVKQGGCIGDAIMHELGTKPFDESKVTPALIAKGAKSPGEMLKKGAVSKDQAKVIAKGWQECFDLAKALAKQVGGGLKLDAKGQACIATKLRKGTILDEYLVVSFTSKDVKDAQEVLQKVIALAQVCSTTGGKGGVFVDAFTQSFVDSGKLQEKDARCVAQAFVDIIGPDKIAQSQANASDPKVQAAFTAALTKAAGTCGVSSAILGG